MKPFPFFRLPAELRNRIYEFLLTDTRGPEDFVDPVILVNDLNRRKERRALSDTPAPSTGQSKKSKALGKRYHMLNDNEINIERFRKRVCELPPLLETAILRVCQQTYNEGSAIMFQGNVFALIVLMGFGGNDDATTFPEGLDLSRVQHLRLEIQLESIGRHFNFEWRFLRQMKALKTVSFIVTVSAEIFDDTKCRHFERLWHTMPNYRHLLQDFIAAIPRSVDVRTGLTKDEKVRKDYGGFGPVRNSVLRKAYKTYCGIQGANVDIVNDKPGLDILHHLPIDGDGNDSDEEGN